ncbi:MAG: 50S ribosomal protein L31 [Candidatus Pacebacteria bacterium]|nr:50S ribosomal protein L31 [Candidatus Paceibacterota bacterium]MBP9818803.1 50S ribosomal protein L31 [Candidatus Paceibacterota bacterium]
MKADIHPTYYPNAVFTCACGATYSIGSTKEAVQVEICAKCHPFYTGTEKTLDSAGRVDKFNTRKAAAGTTKAKSAKK